MKRLFKSIFAFLLAVFFSLPAFSGFKADAEVWVNWTSWDHMKELGTFATREKACEAFGPYMLRKGMSPEWSVSTSNNEAEKFCEVTAVHVNSTVSLYKMDYAYFYNCPSGTVKSGAWCYCPDDKTEFGRACLAPPVLSANENMCRAEGKIFGNPVLPASAEKFRSETDWKGEGPFAIDFVRTYRSKVDLNHARSQSVLGPGWTHNHDIRLVALGNDDDRTVLISASHEQMDAFRSTDKGVTWTAFAGAASLSRSSGGGWTYLPALDDAVWSFDGDGKLRSRSLLNGWEMVYAYDAQGFLQSVRNSFGAEITLEYDAQARLKKMSPPDGGALQYEYDSDGRLISVSYPDGASRGFLYEVPGENYLLTGIVGEDGNRLGYFNFDADGRVISSELAGGVERYSVAYPYQSYARVKDPLGTERTYTYSMKAAQLVVNSATMPSADGRSSVSGRNQDDSGLIELERDFRGSIKHWAWDTNRRLPLKITEAAGSAEQRTTTTLWHPQWRLPAKVTGAGSEASYGYDGAGNLLSLVLKDTTVAPARSRTWNWSYHPSGLVATQTQPNGAITRFNYDGSGNLTQSTNALNQTETYTHDSAGRVLTHLSASGVASSFQYDARGRLVRMQLGGHVSLYSYYPAGQLATAGTPQGYTLTYRYDQAHRLTGWSDNRGAGASYTLDGMGNRVLEQIVDPQGKAAWQLARSINSINRVERVTFGGVDGAEVLSTIQYGYNANGDLAYTTQTANGVSANTVLDLDPLRRVKTITNAHNASATLFYDTLDAVTSAQDFKGVTTTYTRDALGNAKAETTPDAGNSTTTYDALGLIATAKDAAGRTLTVQRDALGRPTQLQYGSTATSTLRYDLPGTTYNGPGAPKASTGHLSEIQDPGVTTQYQRDILGRVLRKSQVLANGDTKSLIHSYVPAGQGGGGELQSITYPSGKQATYLYDSTGQITGLQWNGQPLVTGLAWSPLGQPTAWQWAGFVQQPGATAALADQRGYNTAGQLASSQLLNLTWDAAGRISLIQQQHMLPGTAAAQQAKLSSAFSYDAVGRLTASAHSAPAGLTLPTGWSLADTIELSASGYAWDGNGNRTEVHYTNALASGTSTLKRNYQTAAGTNRLQSYAQTLQRPGSAAQNSNVTFSYDAAGALVKKGDNHLHYGADGRIAKAGEYADAADARAVSYVYNALGQRVFKSDARGAGQPATLQTLYAEDGIGSTVLGQYANQRSANSAAPAGQSDSTEIIYLPTASGPMPIAAEINGRLYAIHTDHLNTPRRLTNQQGQVAWQWLISGFGEVRPTTGDRGYGQTVSGPSYAQAVKFDLRYPGQVFDEETGLSYNLHRYYDAATGRYIQADPIGLEGGWNRFGYVGGDPLNAIDPDGLNAVVALNRIAEVGRGLYYRYGPAITEFIAGASGVNGAVASPAAISPLVAQIPTGVSRMLPIARGISEGVESGAFCSSVDASNVANIPRLARQLTNESARSPFLPNGALTKEALARSRAMPNLGPGQLSNPAIPAGYGKYTTETFQSLAGDYQMHFYMNPGTGEVFYGLDYKAIFNNYSGALK